MSDFDVVGRLRTLAGDLMFDMHDHDAGYCLRSPIELADEVWVRDVEESRYLDGDAETHARLAAGRIVVGVHLDGVSWVQVEQRRLALRAAYISVPAFLLDVTLEGVTQTFRANRPDVSSLSVESGDLGVKRRTVQLSFPVQPNPTVTGV